jgi:centrin-1
MESKNLNKQNIRVKKIRQLLSPSQKNDIKKAFDYFDQGGAGKIKKRELKVILRALGFDPTNEELDKLVGNDINDIDNITDEIDFQEFMDIMLAKIEQQLSTEDIKYAFQKIAKIQNKKDEKDYNYLYSEDIMESAKALDEKLSIEDRRDAV